MPLAHFVSQSRRSHRGCMAHRIASWLRACVRAWLGGRAGNPISSASVTASKIAALQSKRAYLATMQSLRVTMHRGFHGGGQRSCARRGHGTETPPKKQELFKPTHCLWHRERRARTVTPRHDGSGSYVSPTGTVSIYTTPGRAGWLAGRPRHPTRTTPATHHPH